MTEWLFRADPYLRQASARVLGLTEAGGIILDRCLFYPAGGGQPGDSGTLDWDGGQISLADAVKGEPLGQAPGTIVLVPDPARAPVALPPVGAPVLQQLDWDRRYGHMRVHSALHLLSVVIPRPVTGGAIGAERGRLDFDMPETPEDVAALSAALNALIARDLSVTEEFITEAALDANPGLIKTLSVQPPRGAGLIRLIRMADGDSRIDLQPCGGTHVARSAEIGAVSLGKIEKKGKINRRVPLLLT